MSEYGVTPQGFVKKRLDTIINELHDALSDGWGVNTRFNPKSFLNVQLTAYSDKVEELWETAEQIYYSMYPPSAENVSLDNAVQYGGIFREEARPTVFPIHCECVDGTTIPQGTRLKTNTSPAIEFISQTATEITRSAFNQVTIRVAVVESESIYTIALNGDLYSYTSGTADTEEGILTALAEIINTLQSPTDPEFTVAVIDNLLYITSYDSDNETTNYRRQNVLILSGNLTTSSVTGIVNFASEANGEISLPDGVITEIVTAVPGLLSVINLLPSIAGRLRQTDVELRQSYLDKIFARSNRMIESIRSAILLNCQGIKAVAGYQNDTNVVDADGRWPHCVEMVVDGGDEYEIALQIWDKKTDGIQTFGDKEVIVPGDEGEPITIRFNRPEHVYVWYRLAIALNPAEILPPNYVDAIKDIIIRQMEGVKPGSPIIPQRLIEYQIYSNVPGIAYIDTGTFYTTDVNEDHGEYAPGIVPITPRQRAVTDETRIEVILGGG